MHRSQRFFSSPPSQNDPKARALNVLIVDDEKANHFILGLQLSRKKILSILQEVNLRLVTKSAYDGEEAVQLYQQASTPYHLIIMDIQMPGIDGYETTRQIRKLNPNAYVIGHSFTESPDRLRTTGQFNDILPKPNQNLDLLSNVILACACAHKLITPLEDVTMQEACQNMQTLRI